MRINVYIDGWYKPNECTFIFHAYTFSVDYKIQEILENLSKLDLTIISITHRPATLDYADRHFALEDRQFKEVTR